MDDQVQRLRRVVRVQRDVEELAVAVRVSDTPPVQRQKRWVVRRQRVDRGQIYAREGTADRPLAQEGGERLDLGQLRHRPIVRDAGP